MSARTTSPDRHHVDGMAVALAESLTTLTWRSRFPTPDASLPRRRIATENSPYRGSAAES
jgi:hypothetical protein